MYVKATTLATVVCIVVSSPAYAALARVGLLLLGFTVVAIPLCLWFWINPYINPLARTRSTRALNTNPALLLVVTGLLMLGTIAFASALTYLMPSFMAAPSLSNALDNAWKYGALLVVGGLVLRLFWRDLKDWHLSIEVRCEEDEKTAL